MQVDGEGTPTQQLEAAHSEKRFVSHPMIKPNSLEERTYQVELAAISVKQNTLAVLPTGLGKTGIALLVVAEFLRQPDSQCVVLAPTRVLVHQHHAFLCTHLNIPQGDIGVLTGEDTIIERKDVWSKRLVCATPQVMLSDIRRNNCDVRRFSLIVFDEVHRAVGNHAYSSIASAYGELRSHGRVLGMTASLPSDKTKVEEIVSKLKITNVEIRDEKSLDVKPYVYKTDVDWIELSLSPPLKEIQTLMKEALDKRLKLLEDASLVKKNRHGSVSLKELLGLRMKVDQIHSAELRSALFSSIRLLHALNLIETQSLGAFKSFMDRLYARRRGYGMSELLNDGRIILAYQKANDALLAGVEHPKISEVIKLVERTKIGEKALVFASYRDSVDQIYSELIKHGFKAGFLIGKSGQSGQSQARQIKALEALRNGEYDILVATQVGEEGLDVAECNLVIFYDNVPSSVRFVQRKGRTGRRREGRVCVLITKGTKDEAYYWLARRRMREVRKVASSLSLD
ncbi:MAG: DEAD/DEAH box helicase, partial [Nitrososphaerales archaeon]